jgi:metallophosphoesterase superfamily enzyme
MADKRVCKTCKEAKDLNEDNFRLRKSGRNKGRFERQCRTCENKSRSQRRRHKPLEECNSNYTFESQVKTEITKDDLTGTLTANITSVGVPVDPIEFLENQGIDTEKYTLTGGKLKCWTSPMKLRNEKGEEVPSAIKNFSVSAAIAPKKIDPIEFGLQEYQWSPPQSRHKSCDRKSIDHETVLVFPDSHFGYRSVNGQLVPTHDPDILEASLKFVDAINPHRIIFLGDTMDFPEFGRHPHGIDVKGHTSKSLEAAISFFHDLREITDCPIDVLEGNHDKRPISFIQEEIKKLAEVPGLKIELPSLSRMLGFKDKNITYHSDPTEEGWDAYSSGNNIFDHRGVLYLHGEKCGKDAVIKTMNHYMQSVCMGHIHKSVCIPKVVPVIKNGRRSYKTIWAISPGFIGSLDTVLPAPGAERDYQQGLTLINHINKSGDWHEVDTIPTPIHIVNKNIFYSGELYAT